jgi:FixJ family two-component response regulator
MIFIVDDDTSIRKAYKNLLRSNDLDCKSFGAAEDFLAHTKPTASDCIILDLKMPGMSGIDLLKELAARGIKIPIIIVSAYADSSTQQQAKNYGVLAVLRKPVNGDALIDLIKFYTRNETALI